MRTCKRFGRVGLAAVLASAVVAVTGCGADPAALKLPGGSSSDSYPIHIEFANALNLPSHARVKANGAEVGQVQGVRIVDPSASHPGSVLADVDIKSAVRLPSDTVAQLRQDTLLGDIYLALDIPASPTGASMAAGDTIPLRQTKPALQIEDVLSGIATFVSGGAVRSAQDTVIRINAALPPAPAETARIANVLKTDVIDVAANQQDLDKFLDGLEGGTHLIIDNQAFLTEVLTPTGVVQLTDIIQGLIHLIGVIGSLGGVAHAAEWLGPLARSGDAAARAFVPMLFNRERPLDQSAPSNLNRLIDFVKDKLIPWVERPSVDIYGVRTEHKSDVSPDDQTAQIVATLRMIGLIR